MINKFLIYVLTLSIPSLGLSLTIASEYLILPAGISGIGKSTITDALWRYFLSRSLNAQTISLDSFYRDGAWNVAFQTEPELFLKNNKETVKKTIELFLKEHSLLGFSKLRLKYLPKYKGQPTWESADSFNWELLINFLQVMSSNSEFHYAPYLYGMLKNLNEDKIPAPIVSSPVLFIDGIQSGSREMLDVLKRLDLKTPTGKRPSILILNITGDLETAIQRCLKRDRDTNRNAGNSIMDEQVAAMLSLKPEQMKTLSDYLGNLPDNISDYLGEDSDLDLKIIDFDNTPNHDFETSLPQNLESALNEWMTK
jgi:uridine kinase